MKRILIVSMYYKTGGVRKSFENLVKYYSEDNIVDILFFLYPNSCFQNLVGHNINILKPSFLLDTYYATRKEIGEKQYSLFRYFLKVIFRILRMIIGSEKLIKKMINMYPIDVEYDVAISFSHDIRVNGFFSGGCNFFVSHKVQAKKKYAWIHGEVENIGLDYETALNTYCCFDEVINVSRACNDSFQLLTKGKVKSDFIYNLFDVNEILIKADEPVFGFDNSLFTFVTVARIHPIKRIDKIIALSKRLYDKGFLFQWYVVGGGDMLKDYTDETYRLGIDGIVHFVGNQANPYRYMKKANVFVLLSDSESFSIVINEALIIGIPVITTDFPAAYESIQNGINGFIVDKSLEAINNCLEYCLQNKSRLEAMRHSIKDESWGEQFVKKSKRKLSELIEN